MTVTISFRVSEELESFLNEEAERRMTTKSTVAQMLLAEKAKEIMSEGEGESGGNEGESEGNDVQTEDLADQIEVVEDDHVEGATAYQFPHKSQADAFRDEIGESALSEGDDKRLKTVRVSADTSESEVVEAAKRVSEKQDSS